MRRRFVFADYNIYGGCFNDPYEFLQYNTSNSAIKFVYGRLSIDLVRTNARAIHAGRCNGLLIFLCVIVLCINQNNNINCMNN